MYSKHLLALTADRYGLDQPFLADLPEGQRLVATNGHVMVAVAADLAAPDADRNPIDVAPVWAMLGKADNSDDWADLVARARVSVRETRAKNKAANDKWHAEVRPLRQAHAAAVSRRRDVFARWKGVRRNPEATQARREAREAVQQAHAALLRHPKPRPGMALVPVTPDRYAVPVPHVQARYVLLVDKALRASGIKPTHVRWSAPLAPVAVDDCMVPVAALMPCRTD